MEWKVVETIASPESGTIFCKVETQYGLNYILWLREIITFVQVKSSPLQTRGS